MVGINPPSIGEFYQLGTEEEDFEDLVNSERVGADDVLRLLEQYVDNGRSVNSRQVIDLIKRADMSNDGLGRVIGLALEGKDVFGRASGRSPDNTLSLEYTSIGKYACDVLAGRVGSVSDVENILGGDCIMAGITYVGDREDSLGLELPSPDYDHLVLDVREGVLDVFLNCEERLYTLNDVKVRDYQGREL